MAVNLAGRLRSLEAWRTSSGNLAPRWFVSVKCVDAGWNEHEAGTISVWGNGCGLLLVPAAFEDNPVVGLSLARVMVADRRPRARRCGGGERRSIISHLWIFVRLATRSGQAGAARTGMEGQQPPSCSGPYRRNTATCAGKAEAAGGRDGHLQERRRGG